MAFVFNSVGGPRMHAFVDINLISIIMMGTMGGLCFLLSLLDCSHIGEAV